MFDFSMWVWVTCSVFPWRKTQWLAWIIWEWVCDATLCNFICPLWKVILGKMIMLQVSWFRLWTNNYTCRNTTSSCWLVLYTGPLIYTPAVPRTKTKRKKQNKRKKKKKKKKNCKICHHPRSQIWRHHLKTTKKFYICY